MPVDRAMTPSGNCTTSGCDVGWIISSAAIASDSRTRVLLAPESAHTRFLGGGFNGAGERKLVVVYLFCLTLGKGELKLILLIGFGSRFLSWPARQAFPPGGEVLDTELRWAARGVFSAVCEHHSALAVGVEAHTVNPAVQLCSTDTSCGLAERFQFLLELCVFGTKRCKVYCVKSRNRCGGRDG